MTHANPLLGSLDPLPFDRVRPKDVEPAIVALLEDARRALRSIGKGALTYESTLGVLDEATAKLETAMAIVSHLEATQTTSELREAYNAVRPEVSAFYASVVLDSQIFAALKAFVRTESAQNLDPVKSRFLTKTLEEMRRHGAELSEDKKKELERISRALAEVTGKFAQNVVDATGAWELVIEDEAKLAGLPDSAKSAARESAKQKGKSGYRFTLQAPSYIAVMTYLDDAGIRERVFRAFNARAASGANGGANGGPNDGPNDNRPLITKILELRKAQAKLLGFNDFADLVLADRMAKDGATARAFVRSLRDKVKPAFAREQDELLAFRRSIEGQDAPPLAAWDVAYYAEKYRRAKFAWDEEELRPYLPLDRVLQGLFSIVENLYGVTIAPIDGVPTWHPSAKTFAVRERDGRIRALFSTDLHPRETKRDGAWMGPVRTGEGDVPHYAVVCANMTAPSEGKPALLTHREVETLFHEVGHMLHHAFSDVPVRSLSGTRVAWDFVELPSQIMENWTWKREALDLFARHHETGEKVPDELFRRMSAARTYRAASDTMRQLGFAEVDLALHCDYDPSRDGDVIAYSRKILGQHAAAPLPDDHAMLAAFTHLFASATGYAAGYYSYKWAEALDADAFTRFEREGILNPETGKAFRDTVLSRGDADDPAALYRAFMGRDPDPDALLARAGLLDASAGR